MKSFEKETIRKQLKDESQCLKDLEKAYQKAKKDCQEQLRRLNSRKDMQNLQSIIYQKKYQTALLKQIDGVLNDLQTHTYKTANEFFQGSYQNGYIGSMYELQKEGIPFTIPIDPKKMVTAIQTDSKISKEYYLGKGLTVQNVRTLKKQIALEATRGIASGQGWLEVAESLAVQKCFQISLSDSMRICRTEGNRINQQARLDAGDEAVQNGCDIVKQWDATLDGKTRPAHQEADGQIREWGEDFIVMGEKLPAPSVGGSASNVCNCRCQLLKRPRWALDDEELQVLKDRASYYGLDKTKNFEEYMDKYLQIGKGSALIEAMRIKQIWKGLPEDKRDLLLSGIENGDPDFIALAEKCMDNCTVDWSGLGSEGTSYYSFGTGHITIYGEKTDDDFVRMFWHEYGHFLDDANVSGSGINYESNGYVFHGTKSLVKHLGYEDAMSKDVSKFLKDSGLDDQFYVHLPEDDWSSPWIYIKDTDEPLDWSDWESREKLERALNKRFKDLCGKTKANNYLYDLGYPRDPKFEDYFEWYTTPKRKILKNKEKYKGARKAWEKALRKTNELKDEFQRTHNMSELWEEQERLQEEAQKLVDKIGGISDTFDESTYGMFMSNALLGGHSADYYRTHPQATEGVANVFSDSMTNDPRVRKIWNEVAPNLYNVISKGWKNGK